MTFDRRAELRDISDQNADRARAGRDEDRSARRYATGFCPSGQHVLASNGLGGGECACGFEVDRDEL